MVNSFLIGTVNSELEDIVAFVRNHEWEDIPESIKDHLEEWEEFLVENL